MKCSMVIGAGTLVAVGILTGSYFFTHSAKNSPSDTVVPLDGSTITIHEDGFVPDTLTVKVGTTVKFVNEDKYWHWPASDPHPSHTFYPEIDPHEPVKPSGVWEVKLDKTGKWGIHDHLAPYVIGTITVTE